MRRWLFRTRQGRVTIVAAALGLIAGLLAWRAPDLHVVGDAFTAVKWRWVLAAFGANVLSTWFRAVAWQVTLEQAIPARIPPTARCSRRSPSGSWATPSCRAASASSPAWR
ncbi:MAG: hypothetical protein R3C15_07895 [Thermoleophilia bacterium]